VAGIPDLIDLGEAVSLSEATKLASDAIEETLRKRAGLAVRALSAARHRRLDRLRRDVTQAVRRGVAARIRMDSTDDSGLSPKIALALLGTQSPTWLAVDAVTSWLGLTLDEIVGRVATVPRSQTPAVPPPDEELRAATQSLTSLFAEVAALRKAELELAASRAEPA
jgi:hypothetical protein